MSNNISTFGNVARGGLALLVGSYLLPLVDTSAPALTRAHVAAGQVVEIAREGNRKMARGLRVEDIQARRIF